jgi:uncharacterized phage protein (TIGR01671 family)
MDRKILYRAKGSDERDKDRWYEGYYYSNSDTTYCFMEDYERAAIEGKDPRHHYILFDQMTDWGLPNRHLQAEIRPETLCQYTGRMDKNHKPIYDGDIVTVTLNDTSYHLIEWRDTAAAFVFTQGEMYCPFNTWHPDCEFEVIGNKFDTPELLEKIPQSTPVTFTAELDKAVAKLTQHHTLSNIRAFLDARGFDYYFDENDHIFVFKDMVIRWTSRGYNVTYKGHTKFYKSENDVSRVINPLCGNVYKEV